MRYSKHTTVTTVKPLFFLRSKKKIDIYEGKFDDK